MAILEVPINEDSFRKEPQDYTGVEATFTTDFDYIEDSVDVRVNGMSLVATSTNGFDLTTPRTVILKTLWAFDACVEILYFRKFDV